MPRQRVPFEPVYRPRLRILIDPVSHERIMAKTVRAPGCGCLLWTGAGERYPVYSTSNPKRTYSLHRVVLEAKLGRPLLPGMQALHTCDNGKCIEEDHLYEGTQKQNMADKHNRGRHPTRYATRVLTDTQVRQIRRSRYVVSEYELARRFGVSRSVIMGIHNRSKYKDVV